MIWKEMPVLKQTAKEISARGGVPIKMILGESGLDRIAVIVSHDPSGPYRTRELHASVSASVGGVRRPPEVAEIRQVATLLNLSDWQTSLSQDGLVGHMWSPLA
jgi:hypothetical protein